MTQRAAVSPPPAPETRENLARALTIGLRAWGFYPPSTPPSALAVDNLVSAHRRHHAGCCSSRSRRSPAARRPGARRERCRRRMRAPAPRGDIIQLSFVGPGLRSGRPVAPRDAHARPGGRRARGGPGAIWDGRAHPAIARRPDRLPGDPRAGFRRGRGATRCHVEGDRPVHHHGPARPSVPNGSSSASSKSRATSGVDRRAHERQQGAVLHAGRLAAHHHAGRDDSRRLPAHRGENGDVALEPERAQEVMQSLTLAASGLDPASAFELLRQEETQGRRAADRQRAQADVRRPASRDVAGARDGDAGTSHQPARAGARYHRARRCPQAPRPDAGQALDRRARLRQQAADRPTSASRSTSCCSSTTSPPTSRPTYRRLDGTAPARARPSSRPAACRRRSSSGWSRSATRACAGCRDSS